MIRRHIFLVWCGVVPASVSVSVSTANVSTCRNKTSKSNTPTRCRTKTQALRDEIKKCRALTTKPFAVNITLLPVGVPPGKCQVLLASGVLELESGEKGGLQLFLTSSTNTNTKLWRAFCMTP